MRDKSKPKQEQVDNNDFTLCGKIAKKLIERRCSSLDFCKAEVQISIPPSR